MNRPPAVDPFDEPTDAQDASRGRSELISRLFREHNDSLVQFLANRLRSEQEAREVAQEAYVRLLSLDSPGAVSFLRAYLFRTATNIAIDRLRRQQRFPHTNNTSLLDEMLEERTPEIAAAGAQEVGVLERLLGELPPKCRRAFLLHEIHGLRVSEVAVEMQLKERMVREYILRALLHCRAGLIAAGVDLRKGRRQP